MASNNWVIHGKHTKSGHPIVANDPHLSMGIPAAETFNELNWGDGYVIGASIPGIPLVGFGRTKSMAWAITATLVDNTDLWEEEVNADSTKYLVDGEWRDLKKTQEQIKVKGEEPIDFTLYQTHRGPMMDFEVISSATALLFAGATPKIDRRLKYSYGWAAQLPVPD